jgi:hypothetical protein
MSDPSARILICPTPGCGREVVVLRPAVEEFISPMAEEKPRFLIVHCIEHGDRVVNSSGEALTNWRKRESHRKQPD